MEKFAKRDRGKVLESGVSYRRNYLMDSNNFEKYTNPNPGAFRYNKKLKKKIRIPAYYKDSQYAGKLTARQKKAMSEKRKPAVECDGIIKLTNEILVAGGFEPVDNPILKGDLLIEILAHSSDNENLKEKYYKEILQPYGLSSAKQLIWMRFANDGHLGVVAASNDINFDHDTNSYKIIEPCKLDWDTSFVLIFPLKATSANIKYNRDDVETAVGNYLIEKGVPILDFYSHNYH